MLTRQIPGHPILYTSFFYCISYSGSLKYAAGLAIQFDAKPFRHFLSLNSHNDRFNSYSNDCNMTSHQNGHPFRNGLINQAGKKRRTSDELPSFLGSYIPVLQDGPAQGHSSSSKLPTHVDWKQICRRSLGSIRRLRSWRLKDLLGIQLALIIVWWVVLWWGEEVVFRRSVEACAWGEWESWVCHIAFPKAKWNS